MNYTCLQVYGIDEYGRYIEENGERFTVEPWPFWGFHPIYLWLHLKARFGIMVWHVSYITGIRWNKK